MKQVGGETQESENFPVILLLIVQRRTTAKLVTDMHLGEKQKGTHSTEKGKDCCLNHISPQNFLLHEG